MTPQELEAAGLRHLDLQPHDILLMFGDDDCCDIQWFEFFVSK